jgi:hypothetical protein
MKVHNFQDVKNQFYIEDDKGRKIFQSYESIIAIVEHKKGKQVITLDRSKWDYSKTTGKYRNLFLGETRKETEKKIKEGLYKLAELN